MTEASMPRIMYIDWLRGLAVVGMLEVHCYDAWLGGAARQSSFFRLSQFSGTIPAPLFVFLAGVAVALVGEKMRRRGAPPREIAARTIRRGAAIFGLGLVFRGQEYLLGLPAAPWTDLLRVDVLNLIGLSIMLMGAVRWIARTRAATGMLAGGAAAAIALATPLLWTTWQPRWLPWYLESYINGVHIYGTPQPWLFPIFPWTAFAFAGLATGAFLFSDWASANPGRAMGVLAGAGAGLFALGAGLDALPVRLYRVYDYWHTSPNFFLARLGIVLVLMCAAYAWLRFGPGRAGFSPLVQFGQTSLLVYWLHTEFVYGRFSIVTKQAQTISKASLGLAAILVAMLLVSVARTRWKGHGGEILAWMRRAPRPATEV